MQRKSYPRPSKADYGHIYKNDPKTIYWRVVAGNRRLSVLEDHDLIFDDYDLKIRKMNLKYDQL